MLKRKKEKLNGFQKLVLVLNCLAALSLLITYLAPCINPAVFWPLAFFSMAYMPILCTNAVFLIYWLVRLRIFALISAVCILSGSGLMLQNVGFRKQNFEVNKASPNYIRIMTYNVYDFINEKDNHNSTAPGILQLINRQQPDILTLQEYFTHNAERGAMANALKKVLHTRHYYFKPLKTTPYDSTGTAIFSKYPIVNQDSIPATDGVKTEGMYVDVKRGEQIFRIYTVHLQSTKFDRQENAYLGNLSRDAEPDLHQTENIAAKLKRAFIERGRQVVALKQQLAKCPYPYIITGDFNDTPLSFAVNYMANGLKNAFREKGYGLGVTWYGQYPGFQLDYMMVSPRFTITNYKILRERLSDHYPVLTDLELK